MTGEADCSETLVHIYEITSRHNPVEWSLDNAMKNSNLETDPNGETHSKIFNSFKFCFSFAVHNWIW
jgi:hypothetical protein